MNRTDRLLAIVLELQRHGERRAEVLAATFGTSKRTIYRDIEALSESGVPIISMTGRGYALAEGYFLPPLMFTTDEAAMLLLGVDVMQQNFDSIYRLAAQSAAAKIDAVLPLSLRNGVHDLQSSLHFIESHRGSNPTVTAALQTLRRAILERRQVRFQYHARWSTSVEEHTLLDKDSGSKQRQVAPYALAHVEGVWYLVGFDTIRQARRHFRLERMNGVTLLRDSFERPTDFRFELEAKEDMRAVVVRVQFSKAVSRWVQEERSFFTVKEEETADGLCVTLHVRQEDEVFHWLLRWGSQARVIEPATLRNRIAHEARTMFENYARG